MFRITYLTDDDKYRHIVEDFIRQWDDNSEHIIAHTSGSTGIPKEILLPKNDIKVSAKATNQRFELNASSRLLCPLSAEYIAGKMMIVRAILANCEIAFCKPSNDFWDHENVRDYILQRHIDLLPVVPSQCSIITESDSPSNYTSLLRQIRNIIIGGAAVPKATENKLLTFDTHSTHFFATYGMTETCSHVALRPIGDNHFYAMPQIAFSTDKRGCLTITAPSYSFKQLQTNDIVTLLSDDCFIWIGRHDNVINSGGIKIFPEELEKKLDGHLPSNFYIKGIADSKWGEAVSLVIEDNEIAKALSNDEILDICRNSLSSKEMPKTIIRVTKLPTTANGKLKR